MSFEEARERALAFRDARDWAQFHNPKDLAISISLESAELLEAFQWSGTDLERAGARGQLADELADIMIYCIYLADRLGLSLERVVGEKLARNEERYPVEKAKGVAGRQGRQ